MKQPGERWANCFFFLCYAIMRGRVTQLCAVSTIDGWFPWHLVGLSERGHAVHFRAVLPHERNLLAPWWFVGRIEGVRRGHLGEALEASGRSHQWSIQSPWKLYGLTAAIVTILFAPWVIAWAAWPLVWFAASIQDALTRRMRVPRSRAWREVNGAAQGAFSNAALTGKASTAIRLHTPDGPAPHSPREKRSKRTGSESLPKAA